jgi:general secretion pathway protein D
MSLRLAARTRSAAARWALAALVFTLAGCATTGGLKMARAAEQAQDYDRAVVEYRRILRAHPGNQDARISLERVRLRAAQMHASRGRQLAGNGRYDEAVVEYQLASELNPTDTIVEAALRDVRQKLRTKVPVERDGRTELQALIDRTRDSAPPGLELPKTAKLPSSLVFGNGSTARAVFTAIARFADIGLVFDPAFRDQPLSIDLRNASLSDALESVTASTRTFYRVTAPRTITVIPDTPAKRREYEEAVVRTFYLSNADLKEVIDLLRVVIDIRQISSISATNAISIKDTPERVAAAAKLIAAIDKARPEVVIDVELLEVDRTLLREYGLQVASPGAGGAPTGISGSADVNRDNLTLQNLGSLTAADVFMSGVPGIYYKLLKNDTATRMLASPELRTSEGITATAKFGDRVPVPVTTFAPIAAGGINTQPITSYVYENIGVNIEITPRTHHDEDVTLGLKVSLSSISGTGFAGLPTFGNREISTTIRLKDGETNMLAGLIRDNERTVLSGVPGLSDLPIIGRLFASNHREADQTDIILTLTPHIVRVLDLNESDLQPFVLSGASSASPVVPGFGPPVREPGDDSPAPSAVIPSGPPTAPAGTPAGTPASGTAPAATQQFPQPLVGTPLPNVPIVVQPTTPKKPGGGGGGSDNDTTSNDQLAVERAPASKSSAKL